jgi:hypothetical protein
MGWIVASKYIKIDVHVVLYKLLHNQLTSKAQL